jgi:hypothetical protein
MAEFNRRDLLMMGVSLSVLTRMEGTSGLLFAKERFDWSEGVIADHDAGHEARTISTASVPSSS